MFSILSSLKPKYRHQQDQSLSNNPSQPVSSDRLWLYRQTACTGSTPKSEDFPGMARVFIIAVIVATALSSCTMVSQEMLPGIEYRENPNVEIIEYDDSAKLQEDCVKQHKKANWRYTGCSLVPYDANEKCIVRIMAGDEKTLKHELAHCRGHADTFLPWMVDPDFY
jgi:hypothetical protein